MLSHFDTDKLLVAEPLTPSAFDPFGGVISSAEQLDEAKTSQESANYGTAIKLCEVSPVISTHSKAIPHLNLFRCKPPIHLIEDHQDEDGGLTYPCKVLERHPHSTQTFSPMGRVGNACYLVIVAPSDDSEMHLPIIEKARAFVCRGDQAVTYGVGVWHAPMISLQETTDFTVFISETGEANLDCEEVSISTLNVEFAYALDTGDERGNLRKPQTEEDFAKNREDYTGPPLTATTQPTGDASFDRKQLKYAVERAYYRKDYQLVLDLVEGNEAPPKLKKELEDIYLRAAEKLKQ